MNNTAGQTETAITQAILRVLEERGAYARKIHGGGYQRAGIPDVIGAYRGHMLAWEVKRPGGRPTRAQARELDLAARAGACARVLTSDEEAREALDVLDFRRDTYEMAARWAVGILERLLADWRGDDRDRSTVRAVLGALDEAQNPRIGGVR